MDVDVQHPTVLALKDQFLCVEYLGVTGFVRHPPLSVQVVSTERTTIAAIDHPVRVEHRNDFDDELFPKFLSFRSARHQELNQCLTSERRNGLARVHSRTDDNASLLGLLGIGDGDHFDLVPS